MCLSSAKFMLTSGHLRPVIRRPKSFDVPVREFAIVIGLPDVSECQPVPSQTENLFDFDNSI